jgi:hypothetical protein
MPDTLTLTIRLHDPQEKKVPERSASWVVIKIARADLAMDGVEFMNKYIVPHLGKLTQLQLKVPEGHAAAKW